MKYLFLFLIIFVVSCAETTKNTSSKPGILGGKCFENNTCNEGLICDHDKCIEDKCFNKQCGDNWLECNDKTGECDKLKSGFCAVNTDCNTEANETCNSEHHCTVPDNDLCKNIDCSDDVNSECNSETGVCECKAEFHKGISGICLFNKKEVSCQKPDIANSEYTDATVTIEWNTETKSWNDVPVCDWNCKEGFFKKSTNAEGKTQYTCEPCSCSEWQTCSDTGACSLTEGRCENNSNCEQGKECDTNHNCVNPASPCEGIDCGGNGTCVVSQNNLAFCDCNENYYDDGTLHCVNPCEGKTCSGHGTCISETILDAHCDCNENYFADGFNCISPCTGHWNCTTNGTTPIDDDQRETLNPAPIDGGISRGTCRAEDINTAICTCIEGYEDPDNDLICTQIDPCNGTCETWETCNSGVCELKPGRCNNIADCDNNLCRRKNSSVSPPPECVCDTTTHYCEPFDEQ